MGWVNILKTNLVKREMLLNTELKNSSRGQKGGRKKLAEYSQPLFTRAAHTTLIRPSEDTKDLH